jgi:hypothetical protein
LLFKEQTGLVSPPCGVPINTKHASYFAVAGLSQDRTHRIFHQFSKELVRNSGNDAAPFLEGRASFASLKHLARHLLRQVALSWWLGFRIRAGWLVQELLPGREKSAQDTAG